MTQAKDDYQKLLERGQEIRLLSSLSMFLEWDQETYMPKGGIDFRSKQVELISSLTHREKTSDAFKKALSKLIDLKTGAIAQEELDNRQKAALREWRRDFLHETKLPNSFVKEFSKATSQASSAWADARKKNTFSTFAPHLKTIIDFCRKKTDYLGYDEHPYDALLDSYEPGVTVKELRPLFAKLKPFLTTLTKRLGKKSKPDLSFLHGNFPESEQMHFNRFLLEKMGADFNHLRLDYSEHPFCMALHPHDVRLTTHTETSSIMGTISAVMHEGGHGLYELGLPSEDLGSPLAEAASFGMHESQSRWYETFIGQSLPFWKFAYPKLVEVFPKQLKKIPLDTFYETINHVEPSLIRVHADEVTYILHVILRFEIELDLIEGKLEIEDLPEVWNTKMQESLGIVPPTDSEGCLQDIHWSLGLFAYFPTYALGNLYAGQIFSTFAGLFPDWETRIANGDLAFIRDFLYENIHRYGRQYSALDLIKRVTGKELSPQPYMDYLETKYTAFLS